MEFARYGGGGEGKLLHGDKVTVTEDDYVLEMGLHSVPAVNDTLSCT